MILVPQRALYKHLYIYIIFNSIESVIIPSRVDLTPITSSVEKKEIFFQDHFVLPCTLEGQKVLSFHCSLICEINTP